MTVVEHNMIFMTFEFADYDFAQSWFINYDLRICRLWLVLNTTWFLSLPKKSDVLYYVPWHLPRYMVHSSRSSNRKTQKKCKSENRTQDHSLAYTQTWWSSNRKTQKSAHAFELMTSHLHAHRPTRYPDKPFPNFPSCDYACILTQAWCGTQDKFGQTAFPEMQLVQILMLRFAVCQ